jgi:hypothetical protein
MRAHILRMAQAIESYEKNTPIHINLFSSQAIVLIPNGFLDTIKKLGSMQWDYSGGFHDLDSAV